MTDSNGKLNKDDIKLLGGCAGAVVGASTGAGIGWALLCCAGGPVTMALGLVGFYACAYGGTALGAAAGYKSPTSIALRAFGDLGDLVPPPDDTGK